MKFGHLLAAMAIVVTIGISLQGAILSYVVSIEHRLTRLETRMDHQNRAPAVVRPPRDLKA